MAFSYELWSAGEVAARRTVPRGLRRILDLPDRIVEFGGAAPASLGFDDRHELLQAVRSTLDQRHYSQVEAFSPVFPFGFKVKASGRSVASLLDADEALGRFWTVDVHWILDDCQLLALSDPDGMDFVWFAWGEEVSAPFAIAEELTAVFRAHWEPYDPGDVPWVR